MDPLSRKARSLNNNSSRALKLIHTRDIFSTNINMEFLQCSCKKCVNCLFGKSFRGNKAADSSCAKAAGQPAVHAGCNQHGTIGQWIFHLQWNIPHAMAGLQNPAFTPEFA